MDYLDTSTFAILMILMFHAAGLAWAVREAWSVRRSVREESGLGATRGERFAGVFLALARAEHDRGQAAQPYDAAAGCAPEPQVETLRRAA